MSITIQIRHQVVYIHAELVKKLQEEVSVSALEYMDYQSSEIRTLYNEVEFGCLSSIQHERKSLQQNKRTGKSTIPNRLQNE